MAMKKYILLLAVLAASLRSVTAAIAGTNAVVCSELENRTNLIDFWPDNASTAEEIWSIFFCRVRLWWYEGRVGGARDAAFSVVLRCRRGKWLNRRSPLCAVQSRVHDRTKLGKRIAARSPKKVRGPFSS